jgi:PAS domain S-box-containing protein
MQLPYERYFDLMPCYVTVQDREFRILAANRRFVEDFGPIEGRYCYQVYKHRSEPCERCPVERTFNDGERHHSEEEVRSLAGRDVSVLVYTTPITDEQGRIVSVMEMSTDVTDLTRLQKQLRESQARYRTLFDEVPCYISVQDRDLHVVETNRRFREHFGDELGRPCYELYKHRREECVPCAVQESLADGRVHHAEEIVATREGETRNVLVYAAPIRDANGTITRVMEMSADITPVRELQSQLTSLGLLVGSVSHGLKGLLTGLDGGIYLVNSGLEKGDQSRVTKGWEMVRRNVARIRSLALDILYYAKDREPAFEPVTVRDVVEEACAATASRAAEHSVTLANELTPAAGVLDADPRAMRALVVNLLENAIDACRVDRRKAEHLVHVRADGDEDEVRLEVADNGIGMDRETREKVFTLFFSSKGTEGTGLGLFISNKIARAHGGRIQVDSKEEQGSCFRVAIPRHRSQPKPDESRAR